MRTNARAEIGQVAIVAAMFVLAIVTLPVAPDRVPVHWDASGRVDGYTDPLLGLFGIPVMTLAFYLLLRYLPLIDPGRANYSTFAGAYGLMRWTILLFLAGIYGLNNLALRGVPVDIASILPLAVGLLLILIGNVMGKLRPNWFVGIRTPWTLSSKRSWTRTHAIGGRVFVIIGIFFLLVPVGRLAGIAPSLTVAIPLAVAMVGIAYLFAYSYFAWRDDPERIPPAGTLPAER